MPTPVQSRDRAITLLISAAHTFSHFYQLLIPALFPYIAEALGLSYTKLGFIVTCFFLASGIGQVLAGFVVDKFGARPFLFFGLVFAAGGTLLAGLTESYPALCAFAFMAGMGNAVFHPTDYSIINRTVSEQGIRTALSVHAIGGNLGYALAPIVAVLLAPRVGWHNTLVIAGAVGLIFAACLACVPLIRSIETRVPGKAVSFAKPRELFAPLLSPIIAMSMAFFTVTTLYSAGISNFGPTLWQKWHSLPVETGLYALSFYQFASIAGIIASTFLVKWSSLTAGQTALRATALAAVFAAIMLWPNLPVVVIFICVLSMAFLGGIVSPSRDYLVKLATPPHAMGRAYGVVYAGFDVGLTIAAPFYGWLIDHQLTWLVLALVMIGFCVNAAIAAWLDKRVSYQKA
jgi:MFS transporter, FSR family, fosmidomycin resistance protein